MQSVAELDAISTGQLVETVHAALAVLASRAPALAPAGCMELAERLGSALDLGEAALAGLVGVADRAGEPSAAKFPGSRGWLRTSFGMRTGRAEERLTLARQLDRLPETRQRFGAGKLAYGHAATIADAVAHLQGEDCGKAEAILLGLVDQGVSATAIAKVGARIKDVIAERDDTAKPDEDAQHGQRSWWRVSTSINGGGFTKGWFSPTLRALVQERLGPLAKPAGPDDDRDHAQRMADALETVLCGGASNWNATLVIKLSADPTAPPAASPDGQLLGPTPGRPDPLRPYPPAGSERATPLSTPPASPLRAPTPPPSNASPAAAPSNTPAAPPVSPSGPAAAPAASPFNTPATPQRAPAAAPSDAPADPPQAFATQPSSAPVAPHGIAAAPPSSAPGAPSQAPKARPPNAPAAPVPEAAAVSHGLPATSPLTAPAPPAPPTRPGCDAPATAPDTPKAPAPNAPAAPLQAPTALPCSARATPQRVPAWPLESARVSARLADGTPIPPWQARTLAFNAGVSVLILGHDGIPLYLGRTTRFVTSHQRRVLEALYGTCAFDECDIPARHCQIDHVLNWVEDGTTDIDLLAPCCGHHNRLKYEKPTWITSQRDAEGRWHHTIHRPRRWSRHHSSQPRAA